MATFHSLRQIAKETGLPLAEVSGLSKTMKLGEPGPFKNSPRRLSAEDCDRLLVASYKKRELQHKTAEGRHRNQCFELQQKSMNEIRSMANLASFAESQAHPASRELRQLQAAINDFDKAAALGPKATLIDPLNIQARERFCRAHTNHYARIKAIAERVSAKI
jgi:hypothetical protein